MTKRKEWLKKLIAPLGFSSWGTKVIFWSVIVSLISSIGHNTLLKPIEFYVYDLFIRLRTDQLNLPRDNRFLLVEITEQDIADLETSPVISDAELAKVIENLQQYEPRVIGIDIFRDRPIPNRINDGIKESDYKQSKYLAPIFENNPNIIIICGIGSENDPGVAPPFGLDSSQYGIANLDIDGDNIVRKVPLFSIPITPKVSWSTHHDCNETTIKDEQTNEVYPNILYSFPSTIVDAYLASDEKYMKNIKENESAFDPTTLQYLKNNNGLYTNINRQEVTLNEGKPKIPVPAQVVINYTYSKPEDFLRTIRIKDVLDGKNLSPELIKDKIVLIGYTAESKKDNFTTPYTAETNKTTPGVVIHAQVVSQLLDHILRKKPLIHFLSEPLHYGSIVLFSVIGGLMTWRKFKNILLIILADGIVVGGLIYGSYFVFAHSSLVIIFVPAVVGCLATSFFVVLFDRVPGIQRLFSLEKPIDWDEMRSLDEALQVESEKSLREQFLKDLKKEGNHLREFKTNYKPGKTLIKSDSIDTSLEMEIRSNESQWFKDMKTLCQDLKSIEKTYTKRNATPTVSPVASLNPYTSEGAIRLLLQQSRQLRENNKTPSEITAEQLLQQTRSLKNEP